MNKTSLYNINRWFSNQKSWNQSQKMIFFNQHRNQYSSNQNSLNSQNSLNYQNNLNYQNFSMRIWFFNLIKIKMFLKEEEGKIKGNNLWVLMRESILEIQSYMIFRMLLTAFYMIDLKNLLWKWKFQIFLLLRKKSTISSHFVDLIAKIGIFRILVIAEKEEVIIQKTKRRKTFLASLLLKIIKKSESVIITVEENV